MTSATYRAALSYGERGWAVLPCYEPKGSGCSCRHPGCSSPGKHPRIVGGLRDASTAQEAIERWWRKWPDANVAVRTGVVSRLVVLDIDVDKGGLATIQRLTQGHGALRATVTVRTGSGGWHYYFAHPGGIVPNSTGRLGPGIDVRGDGGYVIAPPSTHASGSRYSFTSTGVLAPLPPWIRMQAVRVYPAVPPPRQIRASVPATTSWARAALAGEVIRVRSAAEGTRNATLNRAAFALGQLIASGHLDDAPVREALTAAALRAGLAGREVQATINSGLRAGTRLPRDPKPSGPARAEARSSVAID